MKKILTIIYMVVATACYAQPTPWIPVGPAPQNSILFGPVSGRVGAIAVSPSFTDKGVLHPATMFIAPEGGGLWKSTNFETAFPNWSPVLDNFFPDAHNIWSIAVSNNNPNEIYAGADNGLLFHSKDDGLSWEKINTGAATDYRGRIIRIILHPITDQVFFATTYTNDVAGGYNLGGVFRQIGKTNTFSQINSGLPTTTTVISDMDYTLDRTGNISIYVGTIPNTGFEVASVRGIWRFQETTGNWVNLPIVLSNDLATGATISNNNSNNIKFACDHHAGAALGIYAAVTDQMTSNLINVYKLVNGNWTTVGSPIKNLGTTYSAFACIIMGMTQTGEVYLGCGNVPDHSVFQTTDGGGHWSSVHNGKNGLTPHNDERSFGFYNGKVYMGDDGGINRFNPLPNFNPGPNTWESLSNGSLQTIMVNGIGIHPTDPNQILCGSQDNAIAVSNGTAWTEIFGGDGGRAVFDQTNPSIQYTTTESKYKFFYRSDDGGKTWNDKSPVDANDAPGHQAAGIGMYAPFDADRLNTKRIVVGLDRIYQTTNLGDSWGTQISPLFFPNDKRPDGRPFGVTATAIAFGTGQQIWAAYGGSLEFSNNNGGDGSAVNWQNVTVTGGFGGNINQIRIDYRFVDRIYLGVDNGSVWRSSKTGNTWNWTNVSGPRLNAVRLNALYLLAPVSGLPLLFAATNQGIYYSVDDGINWWPFNKGLPLSTATCLDYQSKTGTLVCGFYGRGVYKNNINPIINRLNLPSLVINVPKDNCSIPAIEGTAATLSFTLSNPGEPGPFTIQWIIDGAIGVAGETYQDNKCQIQIPDPAPHIQATVVLTYQDGLQVTTTATVPTMNQEQASLITFFCNHRERLKPIPWWEWDPAKWQLDPKTNSMILQRFTKKDLLLFQRNMQVSMQKLQQLIQATRE